MSSDRHTDISGQLAIAEIEAKQCVFDRLLELMCSKDDLSKRICTGELSVKSFITTMLIEPLGLVSARYQRLVDECEAGSHRLERAHQIVNAILQIAETIAA